MQDVKNVDKISLPARGSDHGPCVEWSDISVTFIFRKSLLTSKVYTVFKIITIFCYQ